MKSVTITLLDGEHEVREPSFGARAIISRNLAAEGLDLTADFTKEPIGLLCLIAGLLTASEPLVDGHHAHTWTWEEVDEILPTSEPELVAIVHSVATLLSGGDVDADPPTTGKRSAAKQ